MGPEFRIIVRYVYGCAKYGTVVIAMMTSTTVATMIAVSVRSSTRRQSGRPYRW